MLYELRRYDVAPTKLPALLDRFGSFTVEKWKQHGFRLIGFWTPLLGQKSNQVVYIWGWESFEERTQKMGVWRADPERARVWAESEKNGPLVSRVYNQLMEPTAYSQLDKGEAYGPSAAGRNPYLFELREYQAMPFAPLLPNPKHRMKVLSPKKFSIAPCIFFLPHPPVLLAKTFSKYSLTEIRYY
jgi:hypothetical protein